MDWGLRYYSGRWSLDLQIFRERERLILILIRRRTTGETKDKESERQEPFISISHKGLNTIPAPRLSLLIIKQHSSSLPAVQENEEPET
jgi:hypothetical protein